MADVTLRLKHNPATGNRELIIDYESEDDALAHEHERDHRALVENVLGQKLGSHTGMSVERVEKEGSTTQQQEQQPVKAPQVQKQGT